MTYRTATGGVTSVAGRAGVVVLGITDVTGLQSALNNIQISGGGVASIEFANTDAVFNGTVLANSQQAFLAYQITDPNDLSNLLLTSLDIVDTGGIGSKFKWEIWEGNPITSPGSAALRVPGATVTTGLNGYYTNYSSSATAFFTNAGLRTGVYLVITNLLTSPFSLAFKLEFVAFPPAADPITLPDAPIDSGTTYSGPTSLATVEVGPGQTFAEPADLFPLNSDGSQATPIVAPGFTMNVHAGTYYKPLSIPPGFDGFTIQAAAGVTCDDIIFNGRGGWVTGYPIWTDDGAPGSGPRNPYRLARGKGFIYTNSPGTIKGIGFWYCGGAYGNSVKSPLGVEQNTGDAEAGIYAESFNSQSTLHIDHCRFDGNENGCFVNALLGDNVIIVLDNCDFSYQVPNGLSTDGLSHNVYFAGGHSITANNCNFYDCNGNSFKCRSAITALNNCFMMQGLGRAIDYPDGGTLTVSDTIFSQKDWSAGGTRVHNFIGLANEHNTRTNTATFTNCTINIAFEAAFFIKSSTLTWTNPTIRWYDDGHAEAAFSYDTNPGNSDTTGVVGITVPSTVPNGTTLINGYPGRNVPGVVARQSLV